MRNTLEPFFIDKKELSTPNSFIRSVAASIPGNSQHWRLQFVFRHAGERMCVVMLYRNHLYITLSVRVLGGEVIRMLVARYRRRTEFVKPGEILEHLLEGRICGKSLQVPDVLADEDLIAY